MLMIMHYELWILAPLHGSSKDISPYGEVYLYNTIAESKPVSTFPIEPCHGPFVYESQSAS